MPDSLRVKMAVRVCVMEIMLRISTRSNHGKHETMRNALRFCRRPKQVPARIQALRWCITFALALLPPVGADSPTLAILAKRAYTIMLADRAAFAFLAGTVRCIHRRASRAQKSTCALNQEQAKSLRSKVHESNGRVALHLFILLCGHTWDPPHSLHVVFWR